MSRIGLAILICLFAARVQGAANIADFTEVTAGHYQVLAQGGVEIGSQVNGFMNEMLKHYSHYFSNWSFKDGARVIVFSNVEDFRAYSRTSLGLTHKGVAGYCHVKTDEDGNRFYELVTYENERIWQTLAHEGFHQFIGYELGDEVPTWLNEGMAQYFENSTVKKGRLVPGWIDPVRLEVAQDILRARNRPSLDALLTMDRATFYANSQITYPMSWALVYYLMTRDGTYSTAQFRRYLQDLKYTSNDIAAFRRRFGRDSQQWQTDFANYILSARPPAEK